MPPHKSYTLCDGIYLQESAAKKLTDESLKWEDRKQIGVRFNPSDQALARILVDTLFNRPFNIVLSFFIFIEVYKHEPWNLSKFAHEFGEGKSYFFTSRKKKYGKGKNIERTTPAGFWQKTRDSSVEIDDSIGKLSVTKTSLTFYKMDENSGKKEKTRWQMKEYTLEMQSYQNFVKPDDIDPLVLSVVYFHDDGRPCGERGPSQVSDNITASSSFPPVPIQDYPNPYCLPIPTQNYSNPYCLQNHSLPLADHDNPGNCHLSFITSTPETFGNFSTNQLYPNSNPGMMTLQQGRPIFLDSKQNMVMGSQGDTYQSSFPEPVLIRRDFDPSPDTFINNLLNQQPDLMDDQPQPDSNSIVCVPTNKIMNPNYPLLSPVLNDFFMPSPEPHLDPWLQSGNEHESYQQQQPNFHSSSDQIIQQQQPSDSAMTWNTNQQNPAELTPTNLQGYA